jgi:glycosidase
MNLKTMFKAMLLTVMLSTTQSVVADDFNSTRTDFRDESIYFAITTRFYDGDPSNNVLCWDNQTEQINSKDPCWRGDFKGLIDKLDYIKALGFTAIWITPIVQNASGYDYHGYHAMDFSKVDLRYESRTSWGASEDVTFQSLIDAAHAKGLKIVLDIVLQHTGNFGENNFCKLFERDQNIRNQASIQSCMHPTDMLGGDAYWDLDANTEQYPARFKYMKNTDGQNHDSNNYWHHVANSWNWDEPSRWWGQIAGDCVDLNTENPAVSNYLVQCYGEFIKMGVDAFRIDTSGHIARLTFNTSFIPQFAALGEQYKSKRLNQCPFYMFGEVCARFGGVTYRDQPNLSPYFYTWKSDESLKSEYQNYDANWWSNQFVREGADPLGNMLTCLEETSLNGKTSDNHLLKNGSYHTPDYSNASGFNVIDFPLHYNFTDAGAALSMAQQGDHLYNDATFNVVYKNGHDYSPQPNDDTRNNPTTSDLFFLFTFRGIPCVYYGSEVDFKAGAKIDNGANGPLSNTGRAYFGQYLEGSVTTTDFGKYTASGNVAQTLNSKLSQYMRRLNQIRQAVPALRKGQYEVISTNPIVFKRAYGSSEAVVAMGNYACPSGYTDVWGGTDGYHIYVKGATGEIGSAITDGANPSFADPGATQWYGPNDAVASATVTLSPNGGTFTTATQSVTATLSSTAKSGWYQIGNGSKVALTTGTPATFTIGSSMSYGESVTVNWGATDEEGTEHTGSAIYKKVDPNATITIYCEASSAPNLYVWDNNENALNGSWPGTQMTATTTVGGRTFYYTTIASTGAVNVIFNNGSSQTGDITGITEDTYFTYDNATTATNITSQLNVDPTNITVAADKASGTYQESVTVTLTASDNNATIVYTTDGTTPTANSSKATGSKQLTFTATTTLKAGVLVDSQVKNTVNYTYTITQDESTTGTTIYVEASSAPYLYAWIPAQDNKILNGSWPGSKLSQTKTVDGRSFFFQHFNETGVNIIFNNGNGAQTNDITDCVAGGDFYYTYNGTTTSNNITSEINIDEPVNITVTADKASGTYEESVTVTLTASDNNATIVYTTDGSAPTANSSKATGSKQLTFTETTTLRAAALVNGTLQNAVSYTYNITKTEPDPVIVVTDITQLNDAIYMEAQKIVSGREGTITIKLKNAAAATAFQFDLELPEGVEVVTATDGTLSATLTSRCSNHKLSARKLSDGTYRFIVISSSNNVFTDNDGDIMTITVKADSDAEAGTFAAIFRNQEITELINSIYTAIMPINVTASLEVSTVTMGDANGDGKVNITDLACVYTYILGGNPQPFNLDAADFDHSGRVNVSDAATLTDILLGKTVAGMMRNSDEGEESDPQ